MQTFNINSSASFTRPADTTAYTINDLVANSTTAGSVVPMSFSIPLNTKELKLYRVQLTRSDPIITNAKFKLYLYGASPTVANGDNGVLSSTSSSFIDVFSIDGTVNTAFSDKGIASALYATSGDPLVMSTVTGGIIYGLLQATAAYTPTSAGTFAITLIGEASV